MITIARPATRRKPKLLRLGVVHQGQIVEERLVDQRRVTIGPSARDTIVVPTMALPRRITLFETRRGARRLCFSPAMNGRVSIGGQVATLEEVQARGLARRRRGGLSLPLDETARGRLCLGEVTVLFQLVTPPPAQARPRLPASVRGGFFANMDWVLACCLVCFAALNSGFLLYLRTLDAPRRAEVDAVPPPFSDYVPRVSPPLPIPATSDIGPAALDKVPPTTTTTTTTTKRPTTSGSPRGHRRACDAACQKRRADERAAMARLVAHQILGNRSSGESAVRDLLRSGAPGTDAERALDGVGGVTVASRQGGRALRVGRCSGPSCNRGVDVDGLATRVRGPDAVEVGGGVREKMPRAEVRPSRATVEGIDPEAVARTVRLGMRAVTDCYQRALKHNPRLGGKVTVRLSINTVGAVNRVSFDDDNLGEPRVASCIQSYASRWRFPPPTSAGAEVAVPIVFKAAAAE